MKDKEKGFTLLETLVVLCIISILVSIPLYYYKQPEHSHMYETAFIARQLKEDIILTQQIAMATGRQTYMRVDNFSQTYVIRQSITDEYVKREYPISDMVIRSATLDLSNSISFLPNGHPSRAGAFILHVGETRYMFTIYIGKGAVSYKKL